MKATVKMFTGSAWQLFSGTIVKRYEKGLTIDDANGVRHYATWDRVTEQDQLRGLLW
jgi:hypothetical protein